MATFRVGVGSFNIKDGAVGIGTESSGFGNLKVEGTIKSDQFDVIESGVSTFTRYSGFSANKVEIKNRSTTLSGENQILSDVVVDNSTFTVGLGSTASIGEIGYACVKHHFSVPTGDTNFRNEVSGYSEGTIRYNTDLGTMEFFNGNEWKQFTYITDVENSPSGRGRALFSAASFNLTLDFVNTHTFGNAHAFGTLSTARASTYGCASETRGVWGGGGEPGYTDVIDYVTIASEGDAIDFGNLVEARKEPGACSSSTRGIWCGGYQPSGNSRTNTLQYVEIQTLGNALDFGDLTSIQVSMAAAASPTRAIFSGGYQAPSQYEVVNIASKGNAVRFGDMRVQRARHDGCSNGTRAVFGAGRHSVPWGPGSAGLTTEIEYITIASEGSASYFGDITQKRNMLASASNNTRGLFAGGYDHPVNYNIIDYITFATTGNALDFGDCIEKKRGVSGLSDSHGGLGGY